MSTIANGHVETQSAVPTDDMTYKQFLRWMGEDHQFEWVQGRVFRMAPVSDEHSDVSGFLYVLLRHWAEHDDLGIVRADPMQMKTETSGRAPDVQFLAKKNLARVKKVFIDGPADLVIEVVSPGYRSRDRKDKFREYESGGVREYWIIDPQRKEASFYLLSRNHKYVPVEPSSEGIYRSTVLQGLWIKLDWLWQRPLPTVLSVLKQWKLV